MCVHFSLCFYYYSWSVYRWVESNVAAIKIDFICWRFSLFRRFRFENGFNFGWIFILVVDCNRLYFDLLGICSIYFGSFVRQMPEQIDWIEKTNELLLLDSLITTASLASHITELRTVERHNWDWIEIVYFNIVLCLYCFTHFFVCVISLALSHSSIAPNVQHTSTNTNEPNGCCQCVRCAVCTILAVLLACWFRAETHTHTQWGEWNGEWHKQTKWK